jgi:uncharacterized membrane protein YidH (DUF202 family)
MESNSHSHSSKSDPQRRGETEVPSANDLAVERTLLAATRTVFALLRTGLAIAGGGALVTSLLHGQPAWLTDLLACMFVLIGYSFMWNALARYRELDRQTVGTGRRLYVSSQRLTWTTMALQLVSALVLVLYLAG